MNKKSICSRVNEHYMLYHGLLGSLSKNELELLPVDVEEFVQDHKESSV